MLRRGWWCWQIVLVWLRADTLSLLGRTSHAAGRTRGPEPAERSRRRRLLPNLVPYQMERKAPAFDAQRPHAAYVGGEETAGHASQRRCSVGQGGTDGAGWQPHDSPEGLRATSSSNCRPVTQ